MAIRYLALIKYFIAVKPVYNGHPQKDRKFVFKTNYHLTQVKSIAECSKGSILQYFLPSLSYHLSFRSLVFSIFEWLFNSGFTVREIPHFSQILGYVHKQKKQKGVDEMLLRLYEPFLWRCLRVSKQQKLYLVKFFSFTRLSLRIPSNRYPEGWIFYPPPSQPLYP